MFTGASLTATIQRITWLLDGAMARMGKLGLQCSKEEGTETQAPPGPTAAQEESRTHARRVRWKAGAFGWPWFMVYFTAFLFLGWSRRWRNSYVEECLQGDIHAEWIELFPRPPSHVDHLTKNGHARRAAFIECKKEEVEQRASFGIQDQRKPRPLRELARATTRASLLATFHPGRLRWIPPCRKLFQNQALWDSKQVKCNEMDAK